MTKIMELMCHICKKDRPDDKIDVLFKPIIIGGENIGEQNIRYCNDSTACIEGAKTFSLFKN